MEDSTWPSERDVSSPTTLVIDVEKLFSEVSPAPVSAARERWPDMNSRFVSEGRTPAQWAEDLCVRGIRISEPTIKERARRLGAFGKIGREMVLLPEHIDRIFQEPTCPRTFTSGPARRFGSTTLRSMNP